MNPRSLRHRLERTAKILVTVQKHLPDINTRFADDKAQFGQIILLVDSNQAHQPQWKKLGSDLEGKGYKFLKINNKWLGNVTVHGTKEEQPDVIFEIETQVDRLNHSAEITPEAYSFKT